MSFKKALYEEDGTSNEKYYNSIIEDGARILKYKSFKLIDNEHDITIKVICKNASIQTIIINDIEDYFIYTDSQINMKNYTEIPTTGFDIQAEVIQRCIDSNWSKDVYFGERDSIFDDYNIYFDEGIEVRIIDGKVYNIIFTRNYKGNVIENLFPGIDLQNVEATLGKPTFEDNSVEVIGYKGEKIYIFFSKDEISIYRNTKIDSDQFFELADEFINENLDLLEFMNELTYIWPDYSEYNYSERSVFISYPLKGIEISINSGDINGILVYNNNKSTLSKISRYLENTNFVGKLQLDSVYEAEKRRVVQKDNLLTLCDEYREGLTEEERKLIGESIDYKNYPEKDANGYIYEMKFISKYNEKPNREINDTISSYLWLNNDYFLYSKSGKGIYFYNLNTGKVQRIQTGSDEFVFKEYSDGILKYDDKEVRLNF